MVASASIRAITSEVCSARNRKRSSLSRNAASARRMSVTSRAMPPTRVSPLGTGNVCTNQSRGMPSAPASVTTDARGVPQRTTSVSSRRSSGGMGGSAVASWSGLNARRMAVLAYTVSPCGRASHAAAGVAAMKASKRAWMSRNSAVRFWTWRSRSAFAPSAMRSARRWSVMSAMTQTRPIITPASLRW